ncbi:MAG TPA: hypothetical protein DCE55_28955 [Planctomycetaceae bacterium]|nr:hypothetical protein [Planctomycetaceae bacterium]
MSTRLTTDTLEPLPRQFSTLTSQEQPDALNWITDSRSCQKWIKSGTAQKLTEQEFNPDLHGDRRGDHGCDDADSPTQGATSTPRQHVRCRVRRCTIDS